MDNKNLSSREILAIIKACRLNQVQVLKFQGLYVSFGKENPNRATGAPVAELTPALPDTEISEIQTQIAEEEAAKDETQAYEARLETLKLTDPAEYERCLMDGILREDMDGSSEEA